MHNQLLIGFNGIQWNNPLRGILEKHHKETKVLLPFSKDCHRQMYYEKQLAMTLEQTCLEFQESFQKIT